MKTPSFEIRQEGGNWRMLPTRPEVPQPHPRIGDVTWYLPYTKVYPLTVGGAPKDAVWVDVSASEFAYHSALAEMWRRGETFAVLEHDVVCRPDIVKEFEECPEPWCVFGYSNICHVECMEAWRNMLGCTRFRKEIIEAVPDAMSSIPAEDRDWRNVCDRLGERLRAAGFTHHFHFPWAHHFSWDRPF